MEFICTSIVVYVSPCVRMYCMEFICTSIVVYVSPCVRMEFICTSIVVCITLCKDGVHMYIYSGMYHPV